MSKANGAIHFENKDDGTVSNYHIGYDQVRHLNCGYRPVGLKYNNGSYPGATWEVDGANTAITIIPSKRILPAVGCRDTDLTGAYLADVPTINYGYAWGHRSYLGDKPMYGRGYCYHVASNVNVLNGLSIVPEIPFRLGKRLMSDFYKYGYGGGWANACCRDNETGREWLNFCDDSNGRTSGCHNSASGRIAYGNWYQDKSPSYIRRADLVTVHGNFLDNTTLADPLWSYFRSPSILYSNTPNPPDVSEDDAENNNGNLVFTFNGHPDDTWKKLIEIETWDRSIVFGCNNQWNTWMWFGGSRCTLYYKVNYQGLHIGASGEMGEKLEYGESESDSWTKTWSFEGTNGKWSLTTNADFDGQGVRFKARIKTLD